MTEEKRVYVRKASGLVRAIGAFGALAVCIGAVSPGSGRFLALIGAISWPGLIVPLWLLIGAVMCFFHAMLYAQIGGAMPRSGGDYVFVNRVIHPVIGFMMSFTFMVTMAFTIGGAVVPDVVFRGIGFGAWSLGVVTNNPGLVSWGIEISNSPTWWFIIGTIAMVIALLIMVAPTKVWLRIYEVALILSIITAIAMGIIFALNSHVDFVAAWNRLLPNVAYSTFISTAENLGCPIGVPSDIAATISGAVLAFWIYLGYQYAVNFAGEIKEATKSIPIAVIGSLILALFAHEIVYFFAVPVVTDDFLRAAGWLFYVERGALPIGFTGVDFASFLLFPNPVWVILVSGTTVLTIVAFWMTAMLTFSRTMFAWSFDRILPSKAAYVTARTRTPLISMIVGFVIIELGVAVACFMGPALVHFNWLFVATLMTCIAAIAGIVFPLKKNLFELAPSYVKKGKLISIMGAITLGIFIFMAYTILALPAIYGPVTEWTIAWVVGLMALAAIIYYASRWYHLKTEGIDITLASKEIPPA
ncbi:MAG: APC family permease [Candidatus Bathyarchaeia archaeon]